VPLIGPWRALPSRTTTTGGAIRPESTAARTWSTNVRAAPARSRHQPVGRDPTTLAASMRSTAPVWPSATGGGSCVRVSPLPTQAYVASGLVLGSGDHRGAETAHGLIIRWPSPSSLAARKSCLDLFEQPPAAVRIVEDGERAVIGMFGGRTTNL
jgi:hypothetical protein